MSSIIAWNIAGELHRPKNMTVGSNGLNFVLKAAFHSSPCLICMLLYSAHRSNFVNIFDPVNWSITLLVFGTGYLSSMVPALRYR